MWNSTADFGNTGGYAQTGGGFFNNTATSPTGSQEKKKSSRMTNIVPCTIAQILGVPENEENLKVGNMTAQMVTFVGIVRSIDSQTTKMSYMIDDMTGPPVEVQMWVGESAEAEKRLRGIQENMYVRVAGAVRTMKGKHHVIAFKILPVEDLNELTMHILETIHASMRIEAMDKQPMDTTSHSMGGPMVPMSAGAPFGKMEDSGGAKGNFAYHGLSKPQQLVLQSISANTTEQGISTSELYNNIKSLTRNQINEAIEFLSYEGHIYSTIDEEHFKPTESA